MKFPVPRRVFAPLKLSPLQMDEIESKADAVLNDTLANATRLLENEEGRVNEHAWKNIKRIDDSVTLYRERKAGVTASRPRSRTFVHHNNSRLYEAPPSFLVVGQVPCSLDDLMYGLSTASAEGQRIRSSYTQEGIIDCQVLEELQAPNKQHPFIYLNLQWLVMDSKSLPLLLQPRDYVVVNGAGVIDQPRNRPRVGYCVRHSVNLDDVAPPLSHWKLVRGAMSMCGIFTEIAPNMVHVYMTVMIEPRASGRLGKSLSTAVAVGQATALTRVLNVSSMKKLARAVHNRESCDENPLGSSYGSNASSATARSSHHVHGQHDSACGACKKLMRLTTNSIHEEKDTTCSLCQQTFCRSCRVRKELSFPARGNGVYRSKVVFCGDCVDQAMQRSAKYVAREELASHSSSSSPAHDTHISMDMARSAVTMLDARPSTKSLVWR